ncbi:MAG: hypothetical protein JW874_00410 [Spirochaetales bacterium]|nr:hypothetical protein [Spirochaetales bacterium]
MSDCEIAKSCPFFNDKMANMPADSAKLKENYCKSNSLHCARFMVYQALGENKIPPDLLPNEKEKAYPIIAEG